MIARHDLVFPFDVDNTLLDNDRLQNDLFRQLAREFGPRARNRYVAILEDLRSELGYADYLGALEHYRLEKLHDMDDAGTMLFQESERLAQRACAALRAD
jgi:hypothetical protein